MPDRLDREYDRDPSLWRRPEDERRYRRDWDEDEGEDEAEHDVEQEAGEADTVMERSEGQEQPRRRGPKNPGDAQAEQRAQPRQAKNVSEQRQEAAADKQ